MGPLDMVLAKDALCSALEKHWGMPGAGPRTQRVLRCAGAVELEESFKELGLELMEAGKKEAGWEFARVWKRFSGGAQAQPVPSDSQGADEEEDEEVEGVAKPKGWSLGLGKAFAKHEMSTTDELVAGDSPDHLGPVTHWQGPEEMSSAAKRIFANGGIGLPLAKAELSAVVRARMGGKATKIVERIEQAAGATELALAVGEAQRKLVRAKMPRLAAKVAKKWQELAGRVAS